MAKDALGHGSDTRGGSNYARQAPTKNGRARMYGASMADRIKIAQDQQNIKEGRSAGSPGDPLGSRVEQVREQVLRNGWPSDTGAANALASGPKSASAPVHDSMRSAGQSDQSYIAQRLTANADKSVGMERKAGESNSSYIQRRVSEPNPNYHAGAVNNAIASSNRSGRKIGGREAKLIHRLLSGR